AAGDARPRRRRFHGPPAPHPHLQATDGGGLPRPAAVAHRDPQDGHPRAGPPLRLDRPRPGALRRPPRPVRRRPARGGGVRPLLRVLLGVALFAAGLVAGAAAAVWWLSPPGPPRVWEATVLLPLVDNRGERVPPERWNAALDPLVAEFGGVTLGP